MDMFLLIKTNFQLFQNKKIKVAMIQKFDKYLTINLYYFLIYEKIIYIKI